MKRWLSLFFCVGLGVGAVHEPPLQAAEDKIRIVATTTTLASLVQEITGDLAEIHAVASPKRDIHFVSPNPKDVLKTKKAEVFIHHGLDTEPWREPLLNAAGNPRFLGDGRGLLDTSRGIELLEIPTELSRKEGDLHAYGNPHYWLDPENAVKMTEEIRRRLAELYPEHASLFRERADAFTGKLQAAMAGWEEKMKPFQGEGVIAYHKSWPYFARRFGLVIRDHLEPKPGIPPTAKHLAYLISLVRNQNVRIIVKEPHQEKRTPEKLSRETGAKVVELAQNVGAVEEAKDYVSMMDYNVKTIAGALS